MMKMKSKLLAALIFSVASLAAQAASPVGVWKTIDDNTNQAKALVEITQSSSGELTGKIIKLFVTPDMLCDKCEGAQKNKPVVGLNILTGLKPSKGEWTGGKILDPKDGKVYSAKAKLIENDTKLEVRGFLGISLLGRTQVWIRQ